MFLTTVYIDSDDTYDMIVAEVDVSVTKLDIITHVTSTVNILTACSPIRIEASTRTAGAPVTSIYISTQIRTWPVCGTHINNWHKNMKSWVRSNISAATQKNIPN